MRPLLFAWVPKTGGTSIWQQLEGGGRWVNRLDDRRDVVSTCRFTTFEHVTADWLVASGRVSEHWIATRFCFAFVRNPWDRLVSIYQNLRELSGQPRFHWIVAFPSFATYAHWAMSGEAPAPGPAFCGGRDYASPQLAWLRLRGQPWLDFVGRFECLDEDWAEVCRLSGFPHGKLSRCNPSIHGPYRDYYTPALRDRVAEFYREEIEEFGYAF